MFLAIQYLKVGNGIIEPIVVNMVDMLRSFKLSSKISFHDDSMFLKRFTILPSKTITSFLIDMAALPILMIRASFKFHATLPGTQFNNSFFALHAPCWLVAIFTREKFTGSSSNISAPPLAIASPENIHLIKDRTANFAITAANCSRGISSTFNRLLKSHIPPSLKRIGPPWLIS